LPEYTEAPLDESIHAFLDLFITDKNQSGLSWWADNYRRFPALSIIARQYLAISAANAEVEGLFSTSATIRTEFRARLDEENAKKLVFTKVNSVNKKYQ